MKWMNRLAAICVGVGFAAQGAFAQINFFHGTWQEALAKAKAEQKPLFVDAYAKWCGPCKWMSSSVFTLPEVGDYFNQHFVNYKLDMETANGREFGAKYPVSAYPTMFFLDGSEKVLNQTIGALEGKDLIALGKSIPKNAKPQPNPQPNPEPKPQPNNAQINFFHGTWQEALAKAKAEQKPLFVDAYAKWCGPCKWMSSEVFTKAAAGEYFNQHFVNYKLDMETANGREFGAKYPVAAYPTLFFLDVNGKLLKQNEGSMDVDDLVALGKSIPKNVKPQPNPEPNPNPQPRPVPKPPKDKDAKMTLAYHKGAFEYLGNKRWVEHAENYTQDINFQELERGETDTEKFAILFDANREVYIYLPLSGAAMMSYIAFGNDEWGGLYELVLKK